MAQGIITYLKVLIYTLATNRIHLRGSACRVVVEPKISPIYNYHHIQKHTKHLKLK